MDFSEAVLPFHLWTACEMYGHQMVQDDDNPRLRRCSDCSEEYEDVEDVTETSGG